MSNEPDEKTSAWYVFTGEGSAGHTVPTESPPWRQRRNDTRFAIPYILDNSQKSNILNAVNAALLLRRPLLVSGPTGIGKSALAAAVANELSLGPVVSWSITSRSTVRDALYSYDAIGRLHQASLNHRAAQDLDKRTLASPPAIDNFIELEALGAAASPPAIDNFIELEALGAAFAFSTPGRPIVLLIDEIDKSDTDLPSDLLGLFEDGAFIIRELVRETTLHTQLDGFSLRSPYIQQAHFENTTFGIQSDNDWIGKDEKGRFFRSTKTGRIVCKDYPFVMMTSNGDRDFPPAFLRRCIRLELTISDSKHLGEVARAWLQAQGKELDGNKIEEIVDKFQKARAGKTLANDQLLNAIYLASLGQSIDFSSLEALLFKDLSQ